MEYLDLPRVVKAYGEMTLPGSKSISNRVLLLAALAQGSTRITGVLDSEDTQAMLSALQALGVSVNALAEKNTYEIQGQERFSVREADLYLANAGTAFRPLTAVLALMSGTYYLHGVARMHERPIGDLVDALRALGADIEYAAKPSYPPLRLNPIAEIKASDISVKGNVSSQFLTALLLAAPLATKLSGQDLVIRVDGDLISKPYIEITLNLMSRFGVRVQRDGWRSFTIQADAQYVSPGVYHVEGDASSASYFFALGAIGGGPLRVHGTGKQSIQGDIAFLDVLEQMGARVNRSDTWVEVSGIHVAQGERLRAFNNDFNLIPDAAMTAAVLALYADGPCVLRNIASWRVKETDRIHAMETELVKLGAQVVSTEDSLTVYPLEQARQWHDAHIGTWDDHRMAMCFSLAAFGAAQVRILDPHCVRKTFPHYFDVYASLVHTA